MATQSSHSRKAEAPRPRTGTVMLLSYFIVEVVQDQPSFGRVERHATSQELQVTKSRRQGKLCHLLSPHRWGTQEALTEALLAPQGTRPHPSPGSACHRAVHLLLWRPGLSGAPMVPPSRGNTGKGEREGGGSKVAKVGFLLSLIRTERSGTKLACV